MLIVKLTTILLCFAFIPSSLCINILYICPVASPSHHIWNKILALGLVGKGHNVTMITHEVEKTTPKNFTVITIEGYYKLIHEVSSIEDFADVSIIESIPLMSGYTTFAIEFIANSTAYKTVLDYPRNSFDLIIQDVSIGFSLLGLAEIFNNSPIVGVTPFLLPFNVARKLGSPIFTSYMPFYGAKFKDVMDLKERVLNFIYVNFESFFINYIMGPLEEKQFKEVFPDNNLTMKDAVRRISIVLANTDPVLENPIPLPPNIILVGGLHARPARPLPQDIKKLMDEANSGAIVFSLGTNVQSHKLKKSVKQALLNAFSKLPQTVFWKFETDDIENVPKNVIIRKWLPQNDMIGHPNTVLFIGHGGILSTQEAVYHGVPIIGIPFAMDQNVNVQRVVNKGIALYLNRKELTSENIHGAITTILNDPKYSKTVKSISQKFKSQPQTALDRAMFWIEHVIEHGDAEHLSPRSRDLSCFELANLDVITIFVSAFLILCWIVRRLIFKLCRFIRPSRKVTKIKTN